jgi:ankyrin repeat protein
VIECEQGLHLFAGMFTSSPLSLLLLASRRTPLHLAASNGHLDIVQMLIRKGVEINPVDRVGGTPLADAIREGHLDTVNFLRSHDAALADVFTAETDDLEAPEHSAPVSEDEQEHVDDQDGTVYEEPYEEGYPENTNDGIVDVLSESFGR